ncbi:hypothetical protein ACFW5X_23050 [Streptomyces albogriseolus]|uniref:hypothetical protein n=1 Tax=Streptomyces TaxID=1883 RepID=UPI002A76404D|nr:hypothetical protein [Streptomyces sp. CL7]WPP31790.1 hypothetical protein SJH97_21785 [Streptomyces sp. CL7]
MNRRTAFLTTLAVTTALTATACGGEDTGASGKPADGKPASQAPSPAPTPTASESSGRPAITFPSDAKNVFEYEKTGDAAKDAALRDSTLGVNSVDEAIFKGSTDSEALGFYNVDRALSGAIVFVNRYIKANDVWVGETRYFDYEVELSGTKKAYVTYCSDESKSFLKNKKTGKVDNTPTTADSYVLYHTVLTKNSDGVWQTTDVASERGSEKCQP